MKRTPTSAYNMFLLATEAAAAAKQQKAAAAAFRHGHTAQHTYIYIHISIYTLPNVRIIYSARDMGSSLQALSHLSTFCARAVCGPHKHTQMPWTQASTNTIDNDGDDDDGIQAKRPAKPHQHTTAIIYYRANMNTMHPFEKDKRK